MVLVNKWWDGVWGPRTNGLIGSFPRICKALPVLLKLKYRYCKTTRWFWKQRETISVLRTSFSLAEC